MERSPPRIHTQWSLLDVVHRLADAGCILGTLLFAAAYSPSTAPNEWMVAGAAAILAYGLLSELSGVYRSWRGASMEREVACALVTWCLASALLATAAWVTEFTARLSSTTFLIWLLGTAGSIVTVRVGIRVAIHLMRAQGFNTRRFAVVGVNDLGIQLARNVEASPELGMKLAGFFDDRPVDRTGQLPREMGERLGDIDELVDQAKRGQIHIVYITFPMRAEDRIKRVLQRLADTTASVYLVPDFFVFQLLHSRWTNIHGLPVVSIFDNPFYGVDGLLKRFVDFCLAGLLLLMAGIPMAIIAVLVKSTSPGPVFFRQTRYGLDGREIRVWKFRTMFVCENGETVPQATRGDSRVTPLGHLLRRSSLDELPQLFNVLTGQMSLVGPRPHANAHNEEYRRRIEGYMLRHKVKPGITGLAQVNGWRGETDTLEKMERRIECDHRYIREWSLWMDLSILGRTVWIVLTARNAY